MRDRLSRPDRTTEVFEKHSAPVVRPGTVCAMPHIRLAHNPSQMTYQASVGRGSAESDLPPSLRREPSAATGALRVKVCGEATTTHVSKTAHGEKGMR